MARALLAGLRRHAAPWRRPAAALLGQARGALPPAAPLAARDMVTMPQKTWPRRARALPAAARALTTGAGEGEEAPSEGTTFEAEVLLAESKGPLKDFLGRSKPVLLAFDTEYSKLSKTYCTTQDEFEKEGIRLASIGWAIFGKDGKMCASKPAHYVVKPRGFEITSAATKIHNISDKYAVAHGRDLVQVFYAFANSCVAVHENGGHAVGHSIRGDVSLVLAELRRLFEGEYGPLTEEKKTLFLKCAHFLKMSSLCTLEPSGQFRSQVLKEPSSKYMKLPDLYKAVADQVIFIDGSRKRRFRLDVETNLERAWHNAGADAVMAAVAYYGLKQHGITVEVIDSPASDMFPEKYGELFPEYERTTRSEPADTEVEEEADREETMREDMDSEDDDAVEHEKQENPSGTAEVPSSQSMDYNVVVDDVFLGEALETETISVRGSLDPSHAFCKSSWCVFDADNYTYNYTAIKSGPRSIVPFRSKEEPFPKELEELLLADHRVVLTSVIPDRLLQNELGAFPERGLTKFSAFYKDSGEDPDWYASFAPEIKVRELDRVYFPVVQRLVLSSTPFNKDVNERFKQVLGANFDWDGKYWYVLIVGEAGQPLSAFQSRFKRMSTGKIVETLQQIDADLGSSTTCFLERPRNLSMELDVLLRDPRT